MPTSCMPIVSMRCTAGGCRAAADPGVAGLRGARPCAAQGLRFCQGLLLPGESADLVCWFLQVVLWRKALATVQLHGSTAVQDASGLPAGQDPQSVFLSLSRVGAGHGPDHHLAGAAPAAAGAAIPSRCVRSPDHTAYVACGALQKFYSRASVNQVQRSDAHMKMHTCTLRRCCRMMWTTA